MGDLYYYQCVYVNTVFNRIVDLIKVAFLQNVNTQITNTYWCIDRNHI